MDQVDPQKKPLTLDLPGPSVQVEVESNMWEPHPPANITAMRRRHSSDTLRAFRGPCAKDRSGSVTLGTVGEGIVCNI